MRCVFILLLTCGWLVSTAQDDVYPVAPQKGTFYITGGTVHVGNGTVINNGVIEVTDGRIIRVAATAAPAGAQVIDATGKQVYPGLILPESDLGLKEIANAVRGSNDYQEIGEWNPDVQGAVAYNTDSRIINTLKSNGIVLANVCPSGSLLAGTSSVMQLDAWNWEDALYKRNSAMELYLPSLINRRPRGGGRNPNQPERDPVKEALDKISDVKQFLAEAKAYSMDTSRLHRNVKFESLRPL
ncbi:MAG TPA: amidohydrolase, partial [Chitinophagaceae bacterium]